jgi:hypothetical protein
MGPAQPDAARDYMPVELDDDDEEGEEGEEGETALYTNHLFNKEVRAGSPCRGLFLRRLLISHRFLFLLLLRPFVCSPALRLRGVPRCVG